MTCCILHIDDEEDEKSINEDDEFLKMSILSHNQPGIFIHYKKAVYEGFSLKGYIEERAVNIANYIIEENATVRQTAKKFGISKSTVHKDVTERLVQINPALASQARKVLDVNKSERHIRGGLATREKYLHQKGAV